jgi:hypothetical protein
MKDCEQKPGTRLASAPDSAFMQHLHTINPQDMKHLDTLLTHIALRHLRIETLESRRRDSLDFHEISVLELRDALEAAYRAGIEQGRKQRDADVSGD